jgi:carbon-monoxide dehydrogenase large subunit
VSGGDSAIGPYGGGAWASRGTVIGGEAALRAGTMLKENILALASAITQMPVDALSIMNAEVINTQTRQGVISLADIGRIGYFRQDTLPRDFDVQLSVTASFVANDKVYYMANGVQASYVEVDCETGFIKMLGQWAVDDCGRIINPLLVDEQVRGGIVQGIGAVLFEECVYSEDANLLNGTMADYLVPMAREMPDILVEHVETPELSTRLGAKGVGEGGLIGAMGSVWVAVNDALKPLGAKIRHQPFTPERVLDALARARARKGQHNPRIIGAFHRLTYRSSVAQEFSIIQKTSMPLLLGSDLAIFRVRPSYLVPLVAVAHLYTGGRAAGKRPRQEGAGAHESNTV